MFLRNPLRGFWAVLLLVFGLMGVAVAQPQRDEGSYQILGARYGTPERNVDVTDRLKQLARTDRNFRVLNDTFGTDPDRGRTKELRIYARDAKGRTRTFEYPENSMVDGSQFVGWSSGRWGNGDNNRWNGGDNRGGQQGSYRDERRNELVISNATYGANGRAVNLTQQLRSMVRDNRLAVKVTNEELCGNCDPAPSITKNLSVSYSVNGRQQRINVREGDYLQIP
ncbi:MAG: DUF3395 domain-containing protein [Burkholderiaceae bacterium]|nr:DUF3395 domain-containing protein [Burkholderiaceae bacterium]